MAFGMMGHYIKCMYYTGLFEGIFSFYLSFFLSPWVCKFGKLGFLGLLCQSGSDDGISDGFILYQ